MKKIFLQLILSLMIIVPALAQEENQNEKSDQKKETKQTETLRPKIGISFSVGGVLPHLQFSEMTKETSAIVPGRNTLGSCGNAMFGASIGLKYKYTIKNKEGQSTGCGFFIASDLFWNPMKKAIREMYDTIKCTAPTYANIPVTVGFNYTSEFSSNFGVWVEAGAGVDVLYKTPEGWDGQTTEYKFNAAFAAQGGVGVIFARTISLGAHYYWLGKHDIVEDRTDAPFSDSMKMGAWVFKLGFHF